MQNRLTVVGYCYSAAYGYYFFHTAITFFAEKGSRRISHATRAVVQACGDTTCNMARRFHNFAFKRDADIPQTSFPGNENIAEARPAT